MSCTGTRKAIWAAVAVAALLAYLGVAPLMDAARDRSLLYAAAVVFAALIVTVGLALIQSMIVTVP